MDAPYLLVGGGRLARHLAHWFDQLDISHARWVREDGPEQLRARAAKARAVLVLLPDDVIPTFVEAHIQELGDAPRIHCSGSLHMEGVQGVHPLGSFGKTLHPEALYRSLTFVVEPGPRTFEEIFPDLPNPHATLDPESRVRYHAAAVMSGNFTAMLWRRAAEDFAAMGIPTAAWHAYLDTVAANLRSDPDSAVTGPLVRGDVGTISAHLRELGDDPWAGVYMAMLATVNAAAEITASVGVEGQPTHPGDRDPLAVFRAGGPIVATTAYDASSAAILAELPVDFLLVGDSAAMVVHGYPSTRAATLEMLVWHLRAVRRGAPECTIVADLPWVATRSPERGRLAALTLMRAGADAVKLEALPDHEPLLKLLRREGIPVMGHVGLLPQMVEGGDYRVAGRGQAGAAVQDAARLQEEAGCFALVIECVPAVLAELLTRERSIPTIGIGAGPATDGQILVLNDLAGMTPGRTPRFVRQFGDSKTPLADSVRRFAEAVRDGSFPSPEESYS